MTRSYQTESALRKLVYFILIVVLLGTTLAFRKWHLQPLAERLELREASQGEVELTGSALRLTLTGSRGLVVCFLWYNWQDKMMRNEWNELELIVQTLTRLQPHFITPWLFQSWNLAYNVAVESDRVRDKYFYVSRGIDLLAEGERQNANNTEIRVHMGIYYRDKIGLSDESNTLRSLLQLSCIDPVERNVPRRFRTNPANRRFIDLVALEQFCKQHPFLVRRLYENLGCKTPKQLVDFLEDNYKLPSRFEDKPNVAGEGGTPKKPGKLRFPILPPVKPLSPFAELDNDSDLGDDFDTFQASLTWFSYAQDPLEPPLNRKPRGTLPIFKTHPAWAQTYAADKLEEDGWFDEELWPLEDWFYKDNSRTAGPRRTVLLGDPRRRWGQEAWEKARRMFQETAREQGLTLSESEEVALRQDPAAWREWQSNRQVINLDHWLVRTEMESLPATVVARKRFHQARDYHRKALFGRELEKFEDADAFGPPGTWQPGKATGWTRLFFDNPRYRNDNSVQEDSYELQLRYLDVKRKVDGPKLKRQGSLRAAVAAAAASPSGSPLGVALLPLVDVPVPDFKGPFAGVDDKGKPWIADSTITTILARPGPWQANKAPVPQKP